MNALYYSLSDEEFNHISSCVTVQKIWELWKIHEICLQVKEIDDVNKGLQKFLYEWYRVDPWYAYKIQGYSEQDMWFGKEVW